MDRYQTRTPSVDTVRYSMVTLNAALLCTDANLFLYVFMRRPMNQIGAAYRGTEFTTFAYAPLYLEVGPPMLGISLDTAAAVRSALLQISEM